MTRKNGELDNESVDALQILLHKIDNQPDKVLPAIREIAEVATKTLKSQTNVDLPRRPPWLVSARGKLGSSLGQVVPGVVTDDLTQRLPTRRAVRLGQVLHHASCGLEERRHAGRAQRSRGPKSDRSKSHIIRDLLAPSCSSSVKGTRRKHRSLEGTGTSFSSYVHCCTTDRSSEILRLQIPAERQYTRICQGASRGRQGDSG